MSFWEIRIELQSFRELGRAFCAEDVVMLWLKEEISCATHRMLKRLSEATRMF